MYPKYLVKVKHGNKTIHKIKTTGEEADFKAMVAKTVHTDMYELKKHNLSDKEKQELDKWSTCNIER